MPSHPIAEAQDVDFGALSPREPTEEDHPRVLSLLAEWWDDWGDSQASQQRALLLPRLYFQHFTNTSTVLEDRAGDLRAFLIGFMSQSRPGEAYVHFVGVDPRLQARGIGRALYLRFFLQAAESGATAVSCITSPGNEASLAFHDAMGFAISSTDTRRRGVPVKVDYDGPGLDRVHFHRQLPERASHLAP